MQETCQTIVTAPWYRRSFVPVTFATDGYAGVHAHPVWADWAVPHSAHEIVSVSPATFVPVDHSMVVGVAVTVADRPGIAAVCRRPAGRGGDAEPRLEVDHHPIGRRREKGGLGLRARVWATFWYATWATSTGVCGPT
jgi:hypothetical protein